MQNVGPSTLKLGAKPGLVGAANDKVLIAAIAAGDDDAMRILFNRHQVGIFRFAIRLVGDAALAEDVVSETFIEVWRQAGRFEGRSEVGTWIMSIARFKALSARRRRRDAGLDEKMAETIAGQACTPEEAVLETDQGAQLRNCLTKLTAAHREIVDLVYYHDKSIEEVAEIIQVPKNTVKTRMFYAHKRLARLLAQQRDFDHMATAEAA
jgi:RNA polymerase sigma-70 factor (ECF subfamily)